MKKFLLVLFSEPFLYVLCPFAVLGVIFIAVSLGTASDLAASGRVAPTMLIFLAWLIIGIVLMVIATQKAKKHTILELGADQAALVYLDPGKPPIFYQKPVWGTHRIVFVNFPEGWGDEVSNGAQRKLDITVEVGTEMIKISFSLAFKSNYSSGLAPG